MCQNYETEGHAEFYCSKHTSLDEGINICLRLKEAPPHNNEQCTATFLLLFVTNVKDNWVWVKNLNSIFSSGSKELKRDGGGKVLLLLNLCIDRKIWKVANNLPKQSYMLYQSPQILLGRLCFLSDMTGRLFSSRRHENSRVFIGQTLTAPKLQRWICGDIAELINWSCFCSKCK